MEKQEGYLEVGWGRWGRIKVNMSEATSAGLGSKRSWPRIRYLKVFSKQKARNHNVVEYNYNGRESRGEGGFDRI